jgi:hypothetical protein
MADISEMDGRQAGQRADFARDLELAQTFTNRARSFERQRQVDVTFLVQFGHVGLRTHIRQGKVIDVAEIATLAPLASFDFSIKAAADVWLRFWQAVPSPGSHDIFALTRSGDMTIEGNLHPFMSNLQYIKDLLAVGREKQA